MAVPSTVTGIAVAHMLQDITKHRITWTANSASESVTSYTVYRSSHRYGTFTSVGTTASTTYYDTPPFCLVKQWFYEVSATNISGEGSLSSAYSLEEFSPWERTFTYSSDDDFDYYSDEDTEYDLESIRKQVTAGLEFGGENCYLIKRKYAESESTGESEGEGESYGRKGTYWDPYAVKVRFVNPNERVLRWVGGVRIETPQRPWMAYYPHKLLVHDKDIILNRQNERFEVNDVTYKRFRGFVYRQECDLTRLEELENKSALDGIVPLDD